MFIEKLSKLKKVLSVTGKEYGSIVLKSDKLLFIRGHKSTYERIPVSELFALYNHGPHINNAIAKTYISGRVQSPAVSIVNAIRNGGTSVNSVLKKIKPSEKKVSDTSSKLTKDGTVVKSQDNFDFSQLEKLDFRATGNLDEEVLSGTGFYFIRLKLSSSLPIRYRKRFDEQGHRIIYIGKAEGQTLADRLDQELLHTSAGTFFRSIGAVLEKTPIPGHLRSSKRKYNYEFSESDTSWIINWLSNNIDVAVVAHSSDFNIENTIIAYHAPILNHTGNPRKCAELILDRARCRRIASGLE